MPTSRASGGLYCRFSERDYLSIIPPGLCFNKCLNRFVAKIINQLCVFRMHKSEENGMTGPSFPSSQFSCMFTYATYFSSNPALIPFSLLQPEGYHHAHSCLSITALGNGKPLRGFYLSFFFGKGFHITHAGLKLAVQARMTLEFHIFPPLSPKCWNPKLVPSCPAPLKMFFYKAGCHWKHKNKTEQN